MRTKCGGRQEELSLLDEVTRVVTGSLPDGALASALPALLGRLIDARHVLALTWDSELRAFDLLGSRMDVRRRRAGGSGSRARAADPDHR